MEYKLWIRKRRRDDRLTWRWFLGAVGPDDYVYILLGEVTVGGFLHYRRPQKTEIRYRIEDWYPSIQK